MCAELSGQEKHVFAIPMAENWRSSYPPRVLITTSSLDPVHTTLSIPGLGFEVDTTITRSNNADISIPVAARVTSAGFYDAKTIIVSSTSDVTVHAFDNDYKGFDGFLVFSSTQLGTEYRIPNYIPNSGSYPSFIIVTALDKETSVHFLTKSGDESDISLQPYGTYRYEGGNYEDLTGTYVESGASISVISGVNTYLPEGECCVDALLVSVPPTHLWGHEFVLTPILTKSCGYIYRVIAGIETTTLTISNHGTVIILPPGSMHEGDVTTTTMVAISADYPVLVAKYLKSQACDDRGDPAMIVDSPVRFYYNSVTFPVFDFTVDIEKHYSINVITNCSDVDTLVFDDDTISMSDWDQLSLADGSMCCVRGEVSPGIHTITSTDSSARFTVSVYMMAYGFAYAYQAGSINFGECELLFKRIMCNFDICVC